MKYDLRWIYMAARAALACRRGSTAVILTDKVESDQKIVFKNGGSIIVTKNPGDTRPNNVRIFKEVLCCPECGESLCCQCAIGADESASGYTERLYSCDGCGSAWRTTADNAGHESRPERYFFG